MDHRINVDGSDLGTRLLPTVLKICEEKAWVPLQFLGAGASAAVFEIKTSEGKRALKVFAPEYLKGRKGEQLRKRVDIVIGQLKDHDCPHLIQIFEADEIAGSLFMSMERAPGKALSDVLKLVPPTEVRNILQQIAQAAKFLEDQNLCHRDIKCDNVVVSDDFKTVKLLDLGVVRWIDEEAGVGTDDNGQLPFVATARYSSPEYMFRLSPPGPDLWRALSFYQLGGVLHDLIAGERLFEDVVSKAKENRYLIAYAVATTIPNVKNEAGVPIDLVLLAQRALTKDMSRRLASVQWDDFLVQDSRREDEIILGLRTGSETVKAEAGNRQLSAWAKTLEESLDRRLVEAKIICKHTSKPLSLTKEVIKFEWDADNELLPVQSRFTFEIFLERKNNEIAVDGTVALCADATPTMAISEPLLTISPDGDQGPAALVDHCYDACIRMAAAAIRQYRTKDK